MLEQHRDQLIHLILGVFPTSLAGEKFFNRVQPGSWNAIVLLRDSYAQAVTRLVETAEGQGWLRKLVQRLAHDFPTRPEFTDILVLIDQGSVEPTQKSTTFAAPLTYASQSAPIAVEDTFDPYEFLHQFDRFDERDHLGQQLMSFAAPPPLHPIIIGILADPDDEYTYFVRRINSDVLKGLHQDAPWSVESIVWSHTATAEYEIRKIAGKKLGSERGDIDTLITALGPAIAGRTMRIEIRSETLEQPAVRAKLEEFLLLWAKLGVHAPPPALYVVVVNTSRQDSGLEQALPHLDSIFGRAGDRLIVVKPVMLSRCEPSSLDEWQETLAAIGKRIDRTAYVRLKKSFGDATFRLRDLMERLGEHRIYS